MVAEDNDDDDDDDEEEEGDEGKCAVQSSPRAATLITIPDTWSVSSPAFSNEPPSIHWPTRALWWLWPPLLAAKKRPDKRTRPQSTIDSLSVASDVKHSFAHACATTCDSTTCELFCTWHACMSVCMYVGMYRNTFGAIHVVSS